MKEPNNLNSLLKHWEPIPSHQPAFAEQVRHRMAASSSASLGARILQFPATLPLAAGIAIMLGVSAAISTDRAQRQDQLATAYALSIDPIQMTSHVGH